MQPDKATSLCLACRQFGILISAKDQLEAYITGVAGVDKAIDYLWEVVDFTRQLILFDNLEEPKVQVMNNHNLVNFICQNQSKVFTENVRLFTPGFPKLDENEHEHPERLQKTKSEIIDYLVNTRMEHKILNEKSDPRLAENMTDHDLECLENNLKDTRDQIVRFKQE